MRLSLRTRRRKWHVVDPIRDLRECPECGALVHTWAGQWVHKEWHEDSTEDAPHDPGGYVIGGAMAPADVPVYADDPDDDDRDKSYWDG